MAFGRIMGSTDHETATLTASQFLTLTHLATLWQISQYMKGNVSFLFSMRFIFAWTPPEGVSEASACCMLGTACPPSGCMPGIWSVFIIILKMLLAFF
jgi:hypothetical protein